MLTTIVLGATPAGTTYMCQMCAEIRGVIVIRSLDQLPLPRDLERLLDSFSPQLVLLEAGRAVEWLELARNILEHHPEISLLPFSMTGSEADTEAATTLGLGLMDAPLSGEEFQEAVFQALARNPGGRAGRLIAFLPAKGGCGATITALGVASIAAQRLNKKVLFLECDIQSGPVAYYLGLQPVHSTVEVLENVRMLDGRPISEFATRSHGMDVLSSAGVRPAHPFLRRFYDESNGRRSPLISAWGCQRLLSHARHGYDLVFCDLPDTSDEAFEPVLRCADQIVVVTDASNPGIALAERRLASLTQIGVGPESISLIINRSRYGEDVVRQIENVAVSACLPDHPTLRDVSSFDLNKIAGSAFESALSVVAEMCTRETIPARIRRKEFSLTSLLSAVTLGWGRSKSEGQAERTVHDTRH